MLYKQFIIRKPNDKKTTYVEQSDVEVWYSNVQERISDMDDSIKEEREGAWQALSDKEKLNISEVFIQNTFGLRAVRKYNFEEKLKIGKAHFLTRVNG